MIIGNAISPCSRAPLVMSGGVPLVPFTPLDVTSATLEAWYDASDAATITESGGLVSQWDDKSVNGRDLTQASGALQPSTGTRTINSINVMDFQSKVIAMASNLSISGDITIITLFETDALTGANSILGADATNFISTNNSTTLFNKMANRSNLFTPTAYATGTPILLILRRTGAVTKLNMGGSDFEEEITTTTGGSPLNRYIGNDNAAASGHGNAHATVSMYSGAISDAEINQLGNAYASIYGVAWSDV